jgi:hypothetical protein
LITGATHRPASQATKEDVLKGSVLLISSTQFAF